jgi:hypothetical protein
MKGYQMRFAELNVLMTLSSAACDEVEAQAMGIYQAASSATTHCGKKASRRSKNNQWHSVCSHYRMSLA